MKLIILNLIVFFTLVGCTTYPSKMKMDVSSIEIIDYEDIDYFRVNYDGQGPTDIAAPTIRLRIKSDAFSYLYEHDKPFHFLCNLKSDSTELGDTEFGRVYYRNSSGVLNEAPYHFEGKPKFSEFYVYMYRSLKADSEVNKHNDIDLISTEFSGIECKLVSPVFVTGLPNSSGPIYFSKNQIMAAHLNYQTKPKQHGIMNLTDYERKISNK